jgi:hypothetical protein
MSDRSSRSAFSSCSAAKVRFRASGWPCVTPMSRRAPPIDARIERRRLPGSRTASPLSHATRRASCSSNASLSSASPPHMPSGMASGRWWRSRHRGAAASGLPKKPLVPRILHRMSDIGQESTLLGYSAFALGMALSALQPSFAPAPAAGWVGWNAAVRRAKPVPMRNRGRLATLTGNP